MDTHNPQQTFDGCNHKIYPSPSAHCMATNAFTATTVSIATAAIFKLPCSASRLLHSSGFDFVDRLFDSRHGAWTFSWGEPGNEKNCGSVLYRELRIRFFSSTTITMVAATDTTVQYSTVCLQKCTGTGTVRSPKIELKQTCELRTKVDSLSRRYTIIRSSDPPLKPALPFSTGVLLDDVPTHSKYKACRHCGKSVVELSTTPSNRLSTVLQLTAIKDV